MARLTFAISVFAGSVLMLQAAGQPTQAQGMSAAAEAGGYIGVVSGDDVFVRAGASEAYYAFAKVNRGALVQVTAEKADWARIATTGPAFKNVLGYIKYDAAGAARLKLSTDGTSATTLGRVDIYAPNLDASNNPGESWKPILRLEADQALTVAETMKTDRELIHKVVLPAGASGWIHKKYIGRASESEVNEWKAAVAEAGEAARPAPPRANATPTVDVEVVAQESANPAGGTEGAEAAGVERATAEAPTAEASEQSVSEGQGNGPEGTAADKGEAAAQKAAEQEAAEAKRKLESLKLTDLEDALKQVQKEDPATAELDPLRNLFLEYADRHSHDAKGVRYARARAEQLGVWMEIQKQRAELAGAQERAKLSSDDAVHARKALDASAEYVVVGKLMASTVYDGARLPKLLRIQDPGSSRTLAYLRVKEEDHDVVSMISQIIGVVGEKSFDEVLQLSIISPRRIDILSPNEETVTVEAEGKQALLSQ